jgi:3-deoxy-D-manno-octulosonic-acid transferase
MSISDRIYALASLPVSVAAGVLFLVSARGRARWRERFGSWGALSEKSARATMWFHGASAGELRGLLPVIERLEARFPDRHVLVTATSVTGLDAAAGRGRETRLLPFDSPVWIKRALRGRHIALFIQTETELWPGLLATLRDRAIPSFAVNAKITDYTAARYRRLAFLFRPLIEHFRCVCVSDELSLGRLFELRPSVRRFAVSGSTTICPCWCWAAFAQAKSSTGSRRFRLYMTKALSFM